MASTNDNMYSTDFTTQFWGIEFQFKTVDDASRSIIDDVREGRHHPVRLINAYTIACANSDAEYRRVLRSGGINLADGRPLALVLRLASFRERSGAMRTPQVRGPELFERVLATSDHGIRHLFFGSSEASLRALERRLAKDYSNVNIVGCISPPYVEASELLDIALDAVENHRADIVWVSLGTPKQDWVANEVYLRTGVTCVAVGAAFDFFSGSLRSAPQWMRVVTLEWLYRFVMEPRRLWRRYLLGNASFVSVASVELARGCTCFFQRSAKKVR